DAVARHDLLDDERPRRARSEDRVGVEAEVLLARLGVERPELALPVGGVEDPVLGDDRRGDRRRAELLPPRDLERRGEPERARRRAVRRPAEARPREDALPRVEPDAPPLLLLRLGDEEDDVLLLPLALLLRGRL